MSDRRIARDLLIYVLNWVRAVFYMMVGVPRNTSRLPEKFVKSTWAVGEGADFEGFLGQWACRAAVRGSDARRGRGVAWNTCSPSRIAHRRQDLEQTRPGLLVAKGSRRPHGLFLDFGVEPRP